MNVETYLMPDNINSKWIMGPNVRYNLKFFEENISCFNFFSITVTKLPDTDQLKGKDLLCSYFQKF